MIDPDAIETKDSGARASFSNGGVRDTQDGKPRFDLVFPKNVPYKYQLFTRVAALMARGAEKYSDRNWEQFSDEDARQRAIGSALRHLIQWANGETDEDHGAAVVFNIMAADYVQGVLGGKWPALPSPETYRDRLWRGTAKGEPAPEYVVEMRWVDAPEGNPNRVVRAKDGQWYWTTEPYETHEVRDCGDFDWWGHGYNFSFKEVVR